MVKSAMSKKTYIREWLDRPSQKRHSGMVRSANLIGKWIGVWRTYWEHGGNIWEHELVFPRVINIHHGGGLGGNIVGAFWECGGNMVGTW
jgi:hypothetical protein